MERFSTGCVNSMMATFIEGFRGGIMALYSGTQPASADEAEGGELLCLITNGGGPFTPGLAANGLNFNDTPVSGVVSKAAGENWTGTVLRDGAATWFRFYANDYTTGAHATAKRFDGRVGAGTDAECQLTDTALVTDGKVTISAFRVTLPMTGM